MKTFFCATVVAIVAILAGCSSVSIHHDVDKTADFTSFRTFDWADSVDANLAVDDEDSAHEIVVTMTNQLLMEKGLKPVDDDPDIWVTYYSGSEKKIDVGGSGYSYGGEYSGWQDAGVGIYPYKEGTLIVDLVDARTKHLVWRGVAQGVMLNPSDKALNKLVVKALEDMFEKYPPSP